ncbi:hypothetical protein [Macrococcus capreoli]|uniref:hypothetical protein n=1 Tax=Macrococcus capreoli TaxID=2982690 RepID=UPI0021D5E078|nr:hypothetical protein [Macrococcus sp. TMW 2.2395]MCU7556666.1 hypothetical protein [Macrococcus sp. TMW 2.2395]
MGYHYHEIFKHVATKVHALIGFQDDETDALYLNMIKNLSPGNDYTFQQMMMEYLTEFQVKRFFFYHRYLWCHNGFHAKKSGDSLIVTEVNADTRLVVGDSIMKMSQDDIKVLNTRYAKLLYYDDDLSQDWSHIIEKQSQMTVLRGDQTYEFDVQQFMQLPDNSVKQYNGYIVVTIYNFDEHVAYDHNCPVILDLRYARGITPQTYHADVILISAQTKGSAEFFIQHSGIKTVGERSFGAANRFETLTFDNFVFVYGLDKEGEVIPDEWINDEAEHDFILDRAKSIVLS